jgi:hypothetical protein
MIVRAVLVPLIFFLLMLPPKQLIEMFDLPNTKLTTFELKKANYSDMLTFFGFILLIIMFEFTLRARLWSTVALS